jgi:hypothetical protein
VKKILSCIIVATVSVSIYCGEQRAIVSVMQPSAKKLKPIKSLEEVKNFAGHFVAYTEESLFSSDLYVIKNSDDYRYGYLRLHPSPFSSDDGYTLTKLLNQNQPISDVGIHQLSDSFLKEKNLLMRKVTPEEMIEIIREWREIRVGLGYYHPVEQKNIDRLIHPSILDLMNAVYCGQYSQLLESPASREFSELWCCIKQQYSNVPKELRKYTLGYLGLLKLQGCVEY